MPRCWSGTGAWEEDDDCCWAVPRTSDRAPASLLLFYNNGDGDFPRSRRVVGNMDVHVLKDASLQKLLGGLILESSSHRCAEPDARQFQPFPRHLLLEANSIDLGD